MTISFDRTIPTLRIFSEEKAKEFYAGFLGFKIEFEHRFEPDTPLYMHVSRGPVVLALSEHHGDGSPGTHITIQMTGLDEYHAELTAKKYKYYRPGIQKMEWGARVMTVQDGFGNWIHFSQNDA